MAILRNAFVKVLPDTSRFDKELKDKLRKTDTKPEAEKVGKEFSSTLTRRIDRELKHFELPTLELKGNPADAVKAIEAARERVEKLRDEADSIELRMRANKALGDLTRFRKSLGDMGPQMGATLGVSTTQGFFATLTTSFKAPPPAVYAGAGLLAAALAPTLGAAVAGAVVGGAGVQGVIGGIRLAAKDARVAAAGEQLGKFILGDLMSRSSGFVSATLGGIDRIRDGWRDMGDDLDTIFESSRFVDPLADGVIRGSRKVVAGVADAVENADPVIVQFARSMDRIGDAVGDMFSTLAEDAEAGASALDDLTLSAENFIRITTGIIHGLAEVKGGLDGLDRGLDRVRYFIEDNSMGALNDQIDLTADGFKYGSREAEAYRRHTLGTADAQDYAVLKMAGMTDAQLGVTRGYRETATAAKQLERQTKLLGDVQSIAGQEMDALLSRTGAVTGAMDAQRTMADLLRTAHDKMFSSVINNSEANEGYEASWDRLSDSVKTNKGTLDIHTEAGRNNRDALQDLLGRTNDLFYAEIETGTSIAGATKKHQDRIAAIKEEARRLGLNKTETEKLIATYGNIPPKKTTDLMLDGLEEIGRALTDLYVFQRSLATGRTLAQVRSDLFGGYAGDPRVFKADGGPIPGHSPSDTADNIPVMATAGEYMIRRPAARALGTPVLDYINAHGKLPGYAQGGSIDLRGRDWGSRMLYPIDVSESYVMSKDEAAKRVLAVPPSGGATAQWMVNVLRQAFPGLSLISGFRPGATTLSGEMSYHALNRAVDYPPDRDMARWVFNNYKARTKEFISPFQEYNLLNGRPHRYTGAVWAQHNWAGGNAHNHWAMANGGVIPEPVFGVGASGRTYSFAERGPETVVPNGGGVRLHPADLAALASAIRSSLMGVSVQMDGRAVGAIQGRQADILSR